uniref:Uncharacterized protein n=1 Tax=Megaselia scalaris TaxID=36166 RepID=T1GEM7_MEGSC
MSSVSGMSPQIESSETPFLYENQYIENNNSIEAVPSSSYVNVDVTATATTPKSCKSVFFDETISRNYENVQETQNTPTSKDPPELPTSPNELTYTVLELVQEEACQQEVQEKTQRPPILTKSFSTGILKVFWYYLYEETAVFSSDFIHNEHSNNTD